MLKPYIPSTTTLRLSLYETQLRPVEKIVFVRHQLACGGVTCGLTESTLIVTPLKSISYLILVAYMS
jgi:hypothetical protein